jgi:serine protease AprX
MKEMMLLLEVLLKRNNMKKVLIILFLPFSVFSQNMEFKFFISFTDKDLSEYNLSEPEKFLSQRSLLRRENQNILLNKTDLPVSKTYISSIRDKNLKILNRTKWFNGVIVSTTDSSLIENINFSFVDSIIYFGKWEAINKQHHERIFSFHRQNNKGVSLNQIYMLWGDSLHDNGFKGEDMIIAVLDAGFYNVDSLDCFSHLFDEGRVLGTYDFVEQEKEVYNDDTHGMAVLSCMGADLQNGFMGTASKANYYLLRTEDAYSENVIEEYNWICGAEFADSIGADVINSSLGYTTFDYSIQNYTYDDLDGKTSPSTIAATMASRKGIIVVNAAGNSGNGSWKYIGAPADADSILTVGAVDENKEIASFSSYGPTSDGRVKPSVCAQGENTEVINSQGNVINSNGTSFASPVLAGLVTCLWQAHPTKSNMEIINAVIQSATLYNNPNDHDGFGLANFYKADSLLTSTEDLEPQLHLYPNPTNSKFTIELYSADNTSTLVRVYDTSANLIYSSEKDLIRFDVNKIEIPRLENRTVFIVVVDFKNTRLEGKIVITE